KLGDIMLVTTYITKVGRTSIEFGVDVKEDISRRSIATIDKIIFVLPHGIKVKVVHSSNDFLNLF
ncbi:MAG: hypothetical protein CME61_05875, partial [Halobacteriovoraceae bacterium]|nr:hypothetical protein [Halobacteriovoraceae bacterium]